MLWIYGTFALRLGHSCDNGEFLQYLRAFSQLAPHFSNIAKGIFTAFRELYFPQHELVLECAILRSTTSSLLTDEEEILNPIMAKSNCTLFYNKRKWLKFRSSFFVDKWSLCLDSQNGHFDFICNKLEKLSI